MDKLATQAISFAEVKKLLGVEEFLNLRDRPEGSDFCARATPDNLALPAVSTFEPRPSST